MGFAGCNRGWIHMVRIVTVDNNSGHFCLGYMSIPKVSKVWIYFYNAKCYPRGLHLNSTHEEDAGSSVELK